MKKRCVTLIEVVVGLALLAGSFSLVGFFMHRSVAKQRFQTSAHHLLEKFRLAKMMALLTDSEVTVRIFKQDAFVATIEGDKPWTASEKALFSSLEKMEGIAALVYQGVTIDSFSLTFQKGGVAKNPGVLLIFPSHALKEEEANVLSWTTQPHLEIASHET